MDILKVKLTEFADRVKDDIRVFALSSIKYAAAFYCYREVLGRDLQVRESGIEF